MRASPNSYEVLKYSSETLKRIIANSSSAMPDDVLKKFQFLYICSYLEHEDTATIIVEHDYTDRYYLEDYSQYYVRSYANYGRSCVRVHFFDRDVFNTGFNDKEGKGKSSEFSAPPLDYDTFNGFLKGNTQLITEKSLNKGYLGFTVIKPVPGAMFGRTCLRVYKPEVHMDKNKQGKKPKKTKKNWMRFENILLLDLST